MTSSVLSWPKRRRPPEPVGSMAHRIRVATTIQLLSEYASEAAEEALRCELPRPCDHCFEQLEKAGDLSRAIIHLRTATAPVEGRRNGRR